MIRKLLVSGGTGLVGKALTHTLARDRDQIVLLVRRQPRAHSDPNIRDVEGHPDRPQPVAAPSSLEGFYAAVPLPGANPPARRWTPPYKRPISGSRIDPPRALGRIFSS